MRKPIIFIAICLLAGVCLAPTRRRIIFPVEDRKYFIQDVDDFGGDVIGPSSSTDNAIARFDGTTGKQIQNSGVTLNDSGVFSGLVTGANGIGIQTTHTPTDSDDPGTTGTIAWDSSYVYVCVSTNSWKRATLSAWGVDELLLETGDTILLETGDKVLME